MKNRIILMLIAGFCFAFNTTNAQENLVEELESKAQKVILQDKIERTLQNEQISRDDLQDCFKLMQSYADLSTTRSNPKIKEVIPEKPWINWVEFNTYMALFVVIMLTLKLFEWIERFKRRKKRDFSFEVETNELINELWVAIHEIQEKLIQTKIGD